MRKRSDGETHWEATGVVLGRGDEGFRDLELLINRLDFPRFLFNFKKSNLSFLYAS